MRSLFLGHQMARCEGALSVGLAQLCVHALLLTPARACACVYVSVSPRSNYSKFVCHISYSICAPESAGGVTRGVYSRVWYRCLCRGVINVCTYIVTYHVCRSSLLIVCSALLLRCVLVAFGLYASKNPNRFAFYHDQLTTCWIMCFTGNACVDGIA